MKVKIILVLGILLTFGAQAQMSIDTGALKKVMFVNESGINSAHLEFCPMFYRDFIMMVKSNPDAEKDEDMDDYFLDISYAAKNAKGNLSRQAYMPFSINSNKHEGQAVFDAVNGKLYFTRSFYDEKRGTNRDSIMPKIYEAKESNNFDRPTVLPFSSDKYKTCHPTLNRKGNKLIFSSNMPGSKAMDLYYVEKLGDGWSEALPLSKVINTEANEVFPYLYQDSLLFFSSNRIDGPGGLDLYYSSLSDTGWTQAVVLPYPINSSFDDIGFLLDANAKSGYTSSNRPGGKGKDDIYRFDSPISLLQNKSQPLSTNCSITVIDKLSFLPVKGASIVIHTLDMNEDAGQMEVVSSNINGEIIMKLKPKFTNTDSLVTNMDGITNVILKQGNYLIQIKAPDFEDQIVMYSPSRDGIDLTIVANPKEEKKIVTNTPPAKVIPTTIGSVVVFDNIYYAYNSADIKSDAARELDLLYTAMEENPNMRIQLSSHTDSRGNSQYNKELSEKRAESARNYLSAKGIDPRRIVTIGFGESRIRNHCIDGVTCTEEEHLYNRRTEVLIIE